MGYKLKRIMMRPNGVEKQVRPTSRLPSAYQEVEYITSSGSQYILTGVYPSYTTSIEFNITPNTSYVSENAILGNRWAAAAIFFMFYQGYYRLHFGGSVKDGPSATNSKTYIKIDNTGYTVNNSFYSNAGGSNFGSYQIYLFSCYGALGNLGTFSLWETKISESGTLVRDFVPCYRKSDNVIGMYDLVNNQFYTNSGSGAFTKGPNV